MGLLQKAVETYEAHTDFVGVARDGHQPIAPVSHIITNASFEIALDMQGELKGIEEVAKEEAKTVIAQAPLVHIRCASRLGISPGKIQKNLRCMWSSYRRGQIPNFPIRCFVPS